MKARASFAVASPPVGALDSLGAVVGEVVGEAVGEALGVADFDGAAAFAACFFLPSARKPARFLGLAEPLGWAGSVTPEPGAVVAPGAVGAGAALPHGPGLALVQATVRNRSCAVRFAVSTSELEVSPGTSTTM